MSHRSAERHVARCPHRARIYQWEPGHDTQPSASSPWTSTKQGTDPIDKKGGDVQELSPRAGTQKKARSAGGKARGTAAEDRTSMLAMRDDPAPTRPRSTDGFFL